MNVNRARATWVVIGVVLAGVLVVTFTAFTGTFLFGLFVYYATRPVYDRLRRRIGSRAVAAATALLTLAVPIIVLLAYTVLLGMQEFDRFASNNDLSQYDQYIGPYLDISEGLSNPADLVSDPGALVSNPDVQALLQEGFNQAVAVGGFLGTAGLHLFLIVVIGYYLLKDGRRLSRWALGKFADDEGVMSEYFRAVDRDFQNVFFGNILNAFLTAILAALVYSLLNAFVAPVDVRIPYPVLAGLLMAVGSLIPVVGILVVYVPVGLYLGTTAYLTDPSLLWFPVLFFVVSFTVIGALPDFVLRPYVAAGSLHVGAVMLAYTFGPLLFGWYGIFLGPVLLVLVTHFARIVLPELLRERTMAPYSLDPSQMGAVGPPDDPDADGASPQPPTDGHPESVEDGEPANGEERPDPPARDYEVRDDE